MSNSAYNRNDGWEDERSPHSSISPLPETAFNPSVATLQGLLAKYRDRFSHHPQIIDLLSQDHLTLEPWTLKLLQCLDSVDSMLSALSVSGSAVAAYQYSTRLLDNEKDLLFSELQYYIKNAVDFETRRYNFSLTRKFTKGGRRIFDRSCWSKRVDDCGTHVEHKVKRMRKVLLCGWRRKLRVYPNTALVKPYVFRLPKPAMRFSSTRTRTPVWTQARYMKSDREAPTTFHAFTRLPVELQNCIWEFCRPEPCIVKLRKKTNFTNLSKPLAPYANRHPRMSIFNYNVYTRNSIPAILAVCTQSRQYALRNWYTFSHPNETHSFFPGVTYFFDPQQDWLYVDCDTHNDSSECGCLVPTFGIHNRNQFSRAIINFPLDEGKYTLGHLTTLLPKLKETICLTVGHQKLEDNTLLEDLQRNVEPEIQKKLQATCQTSVWKYNTWHKEFQKRTELEYEQAIREGKPVRDIPAGKWIDLPYKPEPFVETQVPKISLAALKPALD